MGRRPKWFGAVLCALVPAALAAPVAACQVPVFRYGLERWSADAYELVVFQRGGDGPQIDVPATANVRLRRVDVSQAMSKPMQRLWDAQSSRAGTARGDLPWMVLRYPRDGMVARTAWSGPVSAMDAVFDSPARREIARRIAGGQSAVWVLLACGRDDEDGKAAAVLEGELAKLEKTLELPDPEQGNEFDAAAEWPEDLRIEFSIVRVARDDPAERVFVSMLLHSEPDLAELDQPMALPVFARGRVLYALVGRGIEVRNIRDACEYITGACSCEVKRQNPGIDLLIAADWDAALTRRIADELDMAAMADRMGPVAPVATTAPVTAPSTRPAAAAADTPKPMFQWWPLAIGLLAAGSGVAYLLLRRSAGRS